MVGVLTGGTVLVEFSDDDGRTCALAPLPVRSLLQLHYLPAAA